MLFIAINPRRPWKLSKEGHSKGVPMDKKVLAKKVQEQSIRMGKWHNLLEEFNNLPATKKLKAGQATEEAAINAMDAQIRRGEPITKNADWRTEYKAKKIGSLWVQITYWERFQTFAKRNGGDPEFIDANKKHLDMIRQEFDRLSRDG